MKSSLVLLFLVVSLYGISAAPAPEPEPLPEPEALAGPAPEPLLGIINGLRDLLIIIIKVVAGVLISILGLV